VLANRSRPFGVLLTMDHADPALAELCRTLWPRLVGLLSLHTGDGVLAEDLAQEALARACRDWRHVRTLDAPDAWVVRVGLNLASSHYRRAAVMRRAQHKLDRSTDAAPEADVAGALAVRAALAALPARERAALLLRYFEQRSVRDTAEVMQCPEGTVKRLTSNALARLRLSGILDDDIREGAR
jgi:RNA polymerase sigma factor (sigma-70 family)